MKITIEGKVGEGKTTLMKIITLNLLAKTSYGIVCREEGIDSPAIPQATNKETIIQIETKTVE